MPQDINLPDDFYPALLEVTGFLKRIKHTPTSITTYCHEAEPELNPVRFRKRVESVEAYYDVKLFTDFDKRKKQMLTTDGQRLLEQARRGFRLLEERDRGRPILVRVATFGVIPTAKLSGALAEVVRNYTPDELELVFLPYRTILGSFRGLVRGKVDAVFTVKPWYGAVGYEHEMKFQQLGDDIGSLLIYAAGTKPPTPDEFSKVRWVTPRQFPPDRGRHIPQTGRVIVPTNYEVLEYVRQGMGCAIFPDIFAAEDRVGIDPHGIEYMPWPIPFHKPQGLPFGVYVANHFERSASERVQGVFKDIFKVLDRRKAKGSTSASRPQSASDA